MAEERAEAREHCEGTKQAHGESGPVVGDEVRKLRAKNPGKEKQKCGPNEDRGTGHAEETQQGHFEESGGEIGGQARSGNEPTSGQKPGAAFGEPTFAPCHGA